MPRNTYRWWLLVLLFGGINPKDPLGRFGSLGRQWVSWSLGSTLLGALASLLGMAVRGDTNRDYFV